jgi:hypothetical protein
MTTTHPGGRPSDRAQTCPALLGSFFWLDSQTHRSCSVTARKGGRIGGKYLRSRERGHSCAGQADSLAERNGSIYLLIVGCRTGPHDRFNRILVESVGSNRLLTR